MKDYRLELWGLKLDVFPILIAIGGYIFIRLLGLVLHHILKKTKIDPAIHRFLESTFKAVLYILLLFVVLDMYNVDTRGAITVLGVSGAAIALALRDSLGNIAGGIIIIATSPFAKNDFIEIEQTSGKVKEVNLFVTILVDEEGQHIIIPNGKVTTSVLVNKSRQERK